MNSKTVAVIQARTNSSRFPGKVLKTLGGLPMIVFMVERVRRASLCDEVCIATSTESTDDALEDVAQRHGVPVHRGDLNDVLSRFANVAQACQADVVVRLTGDCPLIDPAIIDRVIDMRAKQNLDYASNVEPPTYPDGLDTEVFTRSALEYAVKNARGASDREHVTPVLRRNEAKALSCGNLTAAVDLSSLRWTVDYEADFDHVAAIVDRLGDRALTSDLFDCLRVVEAAGLRDAGGRFARNEAYQPD